MLFNKLNCFLVLCILSLLVFSFGNAHDNGKEGLSEHHNQKQNCTNVKNCPMTPAKCPSGEHLVLKDCCHICEDLSKSNNCTHTKCDHEKKKCEKNHHQVKVDCCEECVACNTLVCPRETLICKPGETVGIPEGSCCSQCVKCEHEKCPKLDCVKGDEKYTPTNECCEKCRPISTKPSTTTGTH